MRKSRRSFACGKRNQIPFHSTVLVWITILSNLLQPRKFHDLSTRNRLFFVSRRSPVSTLLNWGAKSFVEINFIMLSSKRLENFLFCFQLETGGLVIGWLGIVTSVLYGVVSIIFAALLAMGQISDQQLKEITGSPKRDMEFLRQCSLNPKTLWIIIFTENHFSHHRGLRIHLRCQHCLLRIVC